MTNKDPDKNTPSDPHAVANADGDNRREFLTKLTRSLIAGGILVAGASSAMAQGAAQAIQASDCGSNWVTTPPVGCDGTNGVTPTPCGTNVVPPPCTAWVLNPPNCGQSWVIPPPTCGNSYVLAPCGTNFQIPPPPPCTNCLWGSVTPCSQIVWGKHSLVDKSGQVTRALYGLKGIF